MKSSVASGCAVLIFVPFACVGMGLAGWSYYLAAQWARMQTWQETAATIENVELKGGGEKSGSGKVMATYHYTFNGQTHTGTNVALHKGGDNIGSFQRRLFDRLRPLKGVQDGAKCYFDPKRPTDAVLNRDSRWEMFAFYSVFSFVFGGLGLLMITGLIKLVFTERRAESRMKQFPEEPWLWYQRWADGKIRCSQRESIRNWTLAGFWAVVCSVPPTFFAAVEIFNGNLWALIGMTGCALTVWILKGVVVRRRHLQLYGEATLQPSAFPLRRGEEITAAVVFDQGELPTADVQVELKFIRRIRRQNKSRTETAWQEKIVVPPENCRLISDGLCIAVPIELPIQMGTTSERDNSATWKMSLSIPTRSVPMKMEFELPVF